MAVEVLSSPHRSVPPPAPGGAILLPAKTGNTQEKSTPQSSPPAAATATAIVAVSAHAARHDSRRATDGNGRGGGAWYEWSGRNANPPPPTNDPDSRVVSDIVWRGRRTLAVQRAALAARAAAAMLCLAALAVLGADRRKGWALDSYNRYSQFRYCEAVNVIGFFYSLFQLYALEELMRKKKHIISRPEGNYFDFAVDQLLAYLLISSSSSATARVGDWITNWGSDPFPSMANGSIAISFLAFLVFAASSLISAYNLFRRGL